MVLLTCATACLSFSIFPRAALLHMIVGSIASLSCANSASLDKCIASAICRVRGYYKCIASAICRVCTGVLQVHCLCYLCPILTKTCKPHFFKIDIFISCESGHHPLIYHNWLVSKPKTVPKYDFLTCIIIYFQDLAIILWQKGVKIIHDFVNILKTKSEINKHI